MDYLINREPETEEKIFAQWDDVIQLHRLLRVLDKTEVHRAMYNLASPCGQAALFSSKHVWATD
jgi:hypothetical protein